LIEHVITAPRALAFPRTGDRTRGVFQGSRISFARCWSGDVEAEGRVGDDLAACPQSLDGLSSRRVLRVIREGCVVQTGDGRYVGSFLISDIHRIYLFW